MLKKSDIYALIGTALFTLCTLLLLLFVYMPQNQIRAEESGIMVSFGYDIEGGGEIEKPSTFAEAKPIPASATTPESAQELLTQDNDETPVLTPQAPKKKLHTSSSSQEEKDKKNKAIEKELKRQQSEMSDAAEDLIGAAMGKSGVASGDTQGKTPKGAPTGKGTSNGHNWSLSGRGLVGRVASPTYTANVEGNVTVSIRVDNRGKVVGVSVGSPTNISDAKTRKAAMDAARKTQFTVGNGVSVGSITYNFNLN